MQKIITIKGIGKVSAAPDLVVLSMNLESRHMNYEKAMSNAADNIGHLNKTLESVGFEKDMVKTTNFTVRTDYESIRRNDGSYDRVFNGYVVSHDLKVEFDFNSERLAKALSAVGSCLARPQLSIAFTVKDKDSICEELLRDAAANARKKAEILCAASNAALGELLSIDYNWNELNVYSRTRYSIADECAKGGCSAIEIEPDDIDVSDTAAFVWGIK